MIRSRLQTIIFVVISRFYVIWSLNLIVHIFKGGS